MPDEITLTLPRRPPFYHIAHLVLGGLAVRLDITFEHLQDLQVALDGVLERPGDDAEITVHVLVEDDRLLTSVGPFDRERLLSALDHPAGDDELTLRRVLAAVVDDFELAERDGGQWIELTKTVRAVTA